MKERLDVLLVKRNLAESREKAKAIIMSGNVFVDGEREDKAGTSFSDDVSIEIKGHTLPYVSRGGLKLEKAIQNFDVSVEGKVCTDVGSSTGGFTDCMLQNGAVKVFAIDVGRGQLAWKLRQDERVVSMEQFNFRYAQRTDFEQEPSFACIDVSFISLSLILPALHEILAQDGQVVALIKPQYEAGREQIGKKGIVKDKKVHLAVLDKVTAFMIEAGFSVRGLDFSPIQGGQGNVEFLAYLEKSTEPQPLDSAMMTAVVEAAHKEFKDE